MANYAVLLPFILTIGLAKPSIDDIYEDYSQRSETIAMHLNYEFIEGLDLDMDIDDVVKEVGGSIESIRFLMANTDEHPTLQNEALDALKKDYKRYEGDELEGFTVYYDRQLRTVKEIHMLGKRGSQVLLISLYGDIKVKNKK